ncbi:hypothetical protein BLOT_012355 [Blomia tropicalis]|nr:hypothetical protein BLOT_012355 [Blomia tropicalis]
MGRKVPVPLFPFVCVQYSDYPRKCYALLALNYMTTCQDMSPSTISLKHILKTNVQGLIFHFCFSFMNLLNLNLLYFWYPSLKTILNDVSLFNNGGDNLSL